MFCGGGAVTQTIWKKTEREKVPLVNLTEVVVIMRRTDNTWEHVERITIAESNTREHGNTNFLSQTLLPHTIITIHKSILYPALLRNFPRLSLATSCLVICTDSHACTHRQLGQFFLFFFSPAALEHGQAKAHFSRGDALSSRGVHMKEQQNIKECPRIHCSAQCEDNLALMENLDQRPGLHNCTFPNKHCAIWRVGQTSGLLRPAPVHRHRQHHSFHLAMFSISVSR